MPRKVVQFINTTELTMESVVHLLDLVMLLLEGLKCTRTTAAL